MSILFGIRHAEGHAVDEPQLRRMASATDRYAPDGTFLKIKGRIGMGYQPYRTHQRSWLEFQPGTDVEGNMVAFDGRLDNSDELCSLLGLKLEQTSDSMIVLECFSRWGEACFSRFVGDWALALWIQAERTLYLARDHAGTRTLYYQLRKEGIVWATYLEPLLAWGNEEAIDENFAAAYLSCQPIRDLTPYKNIRAVTPAHYLAIQERLVALKPHWKWMTGERIRYATDAAYDEHFLYLFQQAVDRRTGPGAPIVAELSGGVDSSSIVCVSDHLRKARGATPADLLDTISYYDDSEPNWNEKPYFTTVERTRGKSGLHIEVSSTSFAFEPPNEGYLWPGPDSRTFDAEIRLENQLSAAQYRTVLSGIGGDELLGGPPDPLPELADYLVSLQFRRLLSQAIEWGLAKKVPVIHLVRDTAALAFRLYTGQTRTQEALPTWLSIPLRYRALSLRSRESVGAGIGHLPSAIDNSLMWWSIMESVPLPSRRLVARREYRYPFLDRDLVDFLLRVAPTQLRRPGRRRLLMRRALRNIVPAEVLERKRKSYIMRGPAVALAENKAQLLALVSPSRANALGYLDETSLQSAVAKFDALSGSDGQQQLLLAIQFELWMRRAESHHSQVTFCSRSRSN